METPLFVFEPDLRAENATLWLALFIGLTALVGVVLLFRRPHPNLNYNQRTLLAMLLFFVFMISAGAAFFSAWATRRLHPVRLYAQRMETPYGEIKYEDIRQARIQDEGRPSLLNPNRKRDPYSLLVIETKSGKTHMLSGQQYPIREILGKLREVASPK